VAYTSAKHGVIGLTKSIAANYVDEGIRCNAVCPGGVKTGIGSSDGGPRSEHGSRILQRGMPQGWGHISEPEDIADVISFLLSHDARNITGAAGVADAGWTMI
jgi:NAD(P)-dependent dehydrogenase (short-subunit alcohol dehydrogenase family)